MRACSGVVCSGLSWGHQRAAERHRQAAVQGATDTAEAAGAQGDDAAAVAPYVVPSHTYFVRGASTADPGMPMILTLANPWGARRAGIPPEALPEPAPSAHDGRSPLHPGSFRLRGPDFVRLFNVFHLCQRPAAEVGGVSASRRWLAGRWVQTAAADGGHAAEEAKLAMGLGGWRAQPQFQLRVRAGRAVRLSLSLHRDEPRLRGERNDFRPAGLYVAPADDGGGADGSEPSSNDEAHGSEPTARCPQGHPMVLNAQVRGRCFPPLRHFGACDVCEARGTSWRCQSNCDFDLCDACHRTFPAPEGAPPSAADEEALTAVPHGVAIRRAAPIGEGCFGSDFAATRQTVFDVPQVFRGPGRWAVIALPLDSARSIGSGKFWLGATVQPAEDEQTAAAAM